MPSFPNRCQHLKVNGTQRGSPALRRNRFCYFHKRNHEERVQLNAESARRKRNVSLELPVLEDANSVQVSLMQIMRLLVAGQIEGKTAGLLLYALQTASLNLRRTSFEPSMRSIVLDPATVSETPLGAYIWDDSDFIEKDEEAERAEILEEARRKARKKEELQRWAEAEADRLIAQGKREREAQRQAAAAVATKPTVTKATQPKPDVILNLREAKVKDLATASSATEVDGTISTAGTAALSKRPPGNVSLDAIRKQIRDQVIKALPALVAAQGGGK